MISPRLREKLFVIFIFLPISLFAQDADWEEEFLFEDNTGITITGTTQTSQQISVIDKEEIDRRGASDIANLLQDTLNLNIVRYGSYGNQTGINLRGFDSKRVAILIDGVQVNSSIDGKFDIDQIDLNSIERIEVIHGGSDSKFNVSGALGGVINIITVKKQPQGWSFGGSVSNTSALPQNYRDRNGEQKSPHWEDLFDTQNVSLFTAYGGETFSFSANTFFNRAQNHFVFTDRYNFPRRKDNNEVMDGGISSSMVWDLPSLSKLIYSANFYYGDKNFPSSGFSSSFGNQQDFSTRQSILLDTPRAFHDNLAAETSLSFQFNRRGFLSPSSVESRHDQLNANAINRWSWFAADKLTLRSGIDYKFNFLNSTEIGNRYRHDGGVYLTLELSPLRYLQFIPSAKAVFSGGNSVAKAAVIPKLGILWNVTDSFDIKNNYFRSFKFPDFEELYWSDSFGAAGNPDLNPEDGWGADIGFDWRITDKIKFGSTFFSQWIIDSIHWYSNRGTWQPENVGKAMFIGVDSNLGIEIPFAADFIKKITPSVSYKYLRSYLLSFGYSFESNKRIPYTPEHTIGGSVDIAWKSGSFLISAQYESLRYHDRANQTELPSYFLLNATVNQKAGEHITIFGSLRNILNTSYESFYDYPMPGITLTLGARVNFSQRRTTGSREESR